MSNEELVKRLLVELGGRENVVTAANCMTRLRIQVRDDGKVQDNAIRQIDGVLGPTSAPSWGFRPAPVPRSLPRETTGKPTRPPSRPARNTAASRPC